MDELAPSLQAHAQRADGVAEESGSPEAEGRSERTVIGGSGRGGEDFAPVVARCTAAALGTGVDCVLDEEFSASRQPARVAGFPPVRRFSCRIL